MARRKVLKLHTPADIRKAIARITNMTLNNEIEPKRANALLYGCNSALSAIHTDEQEKKLLEIQTILEEIIKD